jgi:general secretion pathway protein H
MMRPRSSRTAGFTLAEIVVVLSIVALSAAVAAPALIDLSRADPETASADAVQELLGRARATALRYGSPVVVTLDLESGRYWVELEDGREARLLATDRIELNRARLVGVGPRARFRFEPWGGASGDDLEVRLTRTIRVSVNRWTGGVHATFR